MLTRTLDAGGCCRSGPSKRRYAAAADDRRRWVPVVHTRIPRRHSKTSHATLIRGETIRGNKGKLNRVKEETVFTQDERRSE